MKRAVQSSGPIRMDEVRGRRGDGEEVTLIVTASPLDEQLIVETYRDVTAESGVRRKYEALLEREKRDKDAKEQIEKDKAGKEKAAAAAAAASSPAVENKDAGKDAAAEGDGKSTKK